MDAQRGSNGLKPRIAVLFSLQGPKLRCEWTCVNLAQLFFMTAFGKAYGEQLRFGFDIVGYIRCRLFNMSYSSNDFSQTLSIYLDPGRPFPALLANRLGHLIFQFCCGYVYIYNTRTLIFIFPNPILISLSVDLCHGLRNNTSVVFLVPRGTSTHVLFCLWWRIAHVACTRDLAAVTLPYWKYVTDCNCSARANEADLHNMEVYSYM